MAIDFHFGDSSNVSAAGQCQRDAASGDDVSVGRGFLRRWPRVPLRVLGRGRETFPWRRVFDVAQTEVDWIGAGSSGDFIQAGLSGRGSRRPVRVAQVKRRCRSIDYIADFTAKAELADRMRINVSA